MADQTLLTDLARQVPKSRFDGLSAQIALDALDTDAALLTSRKIPTTRREPDDVGFIARVLIVQGKTELVWRYLRFCLHYWPCEPALVSLFAQSANKVGRQCETIAALAVMEEKTGAHTPEILSNLVLLNAAIGESDAAFVAFRSCLSQGGFPQQNAYRMLLRCMIGDGRGAKLALLIEEQEASGLWKTPHPQKTYHGQLITEVKIALASGVDGPVRKVGPRDRSGHVALMRDHPESNVTAMRTMRHWLLFGPSSNLETANSIPRQIAQYWDAETPPARIASMMDTWRNHSDFGYQRFDRRTATAYLRDHFTTITVTAFRLARNPAEEADFFRLCFLAHEGGVYADADDRLVGDLNTALSEGAEFIALLEPGFANLGNNFIAAAANHPVLMDAVERAQTALLSRAAETTWSKTGPGLLTRALANELTRGPKKKAGAGIRLLSLADISGIVVIHNAAEHKNAASDWRLS
jgi:hypothetical protein